MDGTLIVCASHHGVALHTQACMTALQKHGARLVSATGIADVALARNDVLTRALADKGSVHADVLLLVDDDMVWTLEAATKLVGLARQSGGPWSGAYATQDGHLAATPLDWDASRTDGLRMTGLGFCAVPVAALEQLAARLGMVIGPHGQRLTPFCQCSIVTPEHDGLPRWCSEDYWLCRALGGVKLAPYVAAGHLKQVPLWPDDETLRRIAEHQPLDSSATGLVGDEKSSPSSPSSPKSAPSKKGRKKRRERKAANASNQTLT